MPHRIGKAIRPGLTKLTRHCCASSASALEQAGFALFEALVVKMPDWLKHNIIFGKGNEHTRKVVPDLNSWRGFVLAELKAERHEARILQANFNHGPSTPRRPAKRPAA